MTRKIAVLVFPIALVSITACDPVVRVAEELLDSRTPRERYVDKLESAGLSSTALVVDWSAAGDHALRNAAPVAAPHMETGFLPPAEASALAFRVNLRRGQQLNVEVELQADTTALLFLDAWEPAGDSGFRYRHIAAADSGERRLSIKPRRDGEYLVRAQPELLRGGRFTISLHVGPTLAFPVQGAADRDIGSVFGDARDGGARSHHGIDIFATRGTPAVAAAPGQVYRVQTTPVGGKVVWIRDTTGARLYYAHLDTQTVTQGQTVAMGDTIGLVGNTGNARTTPPHLHFGIYSRGPIDPYWFVHTPRGTMPRLTADTSRAGSLSRVAGAGITLRASPTTRGDSLLTLPRQTAIRILAGTGGWYRVRLPDGVTGYIPANSTESVASALRPAVTAVDEHLLARPSDTPEPGDMLSVIPAGSRVAVVAHFGNYSLVTSSGITGWLQNLPAASIQ